MNPSTPGWAARLVGVLGAPLDALGEKHLQALVDNGIREDADLDFKQERYGNGESEKRELAGDVGAMANDRGGLLVMGIRDENDVAAELTPVELVDGEEGRIRQIVAGNLAPYVAIEVHVVKSASKAGHGYYLVSVPPSALRPHAVRKGRDLRYPRRDGTTTRWLTETELADMYRDRFRQATDQTDRAAQVLEEGLGAMDTSDDAFLVLALVPTAPGSMPIDRLQMDAIQEWAKQVGPAHWWLGFFPPGGSAPWARVGTRRITLASLFEPEPPSSDYAELHADGAAFAGVWIHDARIGQRLDERPGMWVPNLELLLAVARALRFTALHASEHCGAYGDVLVQAALVGTEMQLTFEDAFGGHWSPIERGRTLTGPVTSQHTLTLDALIGPDEALLAAARLVAADLYNAFGSPEVRHVTTEGKLRIGYFRGDTRQLSQLADERDVTLTDEPVPGD